MTTDEALISAAERLDSAGVAEPRRQAASLLTFALGKPHAFLIAHPEYELNDDERQGFDDIVARRVSHEPFQYITGRQEFWGLEFEVASGALIPRPETELLVEAAIEHLRGLEHPRFAEAGIGSGCISVSVLHTVTNATAVATDISQAAVVIAKRNAVRHGVTDRLAIRHADLLDGLEGPIDLILSNPPYIPNGDIEALQPEVRDFEPRSALDGGTDGLDIVRRLVNDSGHILAIGGVLMMEIGVGQATAVANLFDPREWGSPEFHDDLQAIPRVVIARRKSPDPSPE